MMIALVLFSIILAPCCALLLYFGFKYSETYSKGIERKERNVVDGEEEEDVVILHQIGRGPFAPSITNFPVKLETFLRLTNIPYVNNFSLKMSPKGKIPWIEHNGTIIADSQFSIEYLKEKFKVDLNAHLNCFERSISRAFQKMTEENLYWTMAAYMFDDDFKAKILFPYTGWKLWVRSFIIKNVVRLEMWGHGIGRHTRDEIQKIGEADLRAISTYLGTS